MLTVLAIITLFGTSLAQRPSNASTCDYYAETLYGANNSNTQFQLVQHIIALAFGGAFNLSNVSSNITGILNPGSFNGLNVDLQPWFNGSIDSTNLNNQPVGINWLDDGGLDPLYDYLSGKTPNVTFSSDTTNEYRLFNHFFEAFGQIFGCSSPQPSQSTGPPLSVAYVHKFMDLNNTDLGHFIDQLTKATVQFGFSAEDSNTLDTDLNSKYNVRCSPPVITSEGTQLYSLCQASTCPLAEPDPDCAAYVNLTANGVASAVPSSQSSTATGSSSTSPSTSATSTSTSSAATSAPTSKPAAALSAGAIAGIAIGAAAVLLIFVAAIVFIIRRRKPHEEQRPYVPNPGYASPPGMGLHNSYMSYAPTVGEMDSPRDTWNPDMSVREPVEIGGYK